MSELEYTNILMDGTEATYLKIVRKCLGPLGFSLETEKSDERVILGMNGGVYTVRHKLFYWNSPNYGSVVWFFLDSGIPHVSSIVSSMGLPLPKTGLPLFVMNLNLKLDIKTYGTIIGHRGPANKSDCFVKPIPSLDPNGPSPKYSKPPPEGFTGIRSVFTLTSTPIYWSLTMVEKYLTDWFTALGQKRDKEVNTPEFAKYVEQYKSQMLSMHTQEGNVFDKIFGDNWVSDLFRKNVFR